MQKAGDHFKGPWEPGRVGVARETLQTLGHQALSAYRTGHAGPHGTPLYTEQQQLQASCKLAPLSGSPFPGAGKQLDSQWPDL